MIKIIIRTIGYVKYKFSLIFATKENFKKFKIDFKNSKIEKILEEISKTDIKLDHFSFLDKSLTKEQIHNCYNQILGEKILKRFQLSPYIFFSYYISLKKLIIPLPNEFLTIFVKNGIEINFFLSNIFLRIKCFFNLIYFFIRCNIRILQIFRQKYENLRDSIFIYDDVSDSHLNPKYGKNLFEWIKNNFNVEKVFSHNLLVNVKKKNLFYSKNNYLPPIKKYHIINLFIFNIYLFFCLLFKQFTSRNYLMALSYEEYFKLYIFDKSNKSNLFKIYLFTTSFMNFKPLWALYVENKKLSTIEFVNYSASYQYNNNKYLQFGINRQNWNKRYEIDDSYINYLIKNVEYKSEYNFDKSIYYSNSDERIKFRNYIAIFDHLVWNEDFLARSLVENNDFLDTYAAEYVKNVLDVCKKLNFKVILKSKRVKWHIKKYHNYLNELKDKNFESFDILYDKSIYEVAKYSHISITAPFTSAAIMSRNYGFKSIYFDYSNKYILNSSKLNYGITTLFGNKELRNYLIKNFKK